MVAPFVGLAQLPLAAHRQLVTATAVTLPASLPLVDVSGQPTSVLHGGCSPGAPTEGPRRSSPHYLKAADHRHARALAACFRPDGTVTDEGVT